MRGRPSVLAIAAMMLASACSASGSGRAATPTAEAASPTSSEITTPPMSAASPHARAYAVMTDAPGKGVLLMGGQYGTPPGTALTDLWSFSPGEGWIQLEPETGVIADAFAYDSDSKLIVLVGQDAAWTYDTVWTYDPSTREWQELRTRGEHPRDVLGARMAYDAGSDRMILFGGYDGRLNDQTWALDLGARRWERMSPETSPPAQNWYATAYEPDADRVILFGDQQPGTWAYDYDTDTWTDLSPDSSPDVRDYSAMVYDPVGTRMILFGGVDAGEEPFGDTWAYDVRKNTWTELAPATSPSARGWHSMAFDGETKTVVLFSGGETRDTDLDDVWLFDPATDTWSQLD